VRVCWKKPCGHLSSRAIFIGEVVTGPVGTILQQEDESWQSEGISLKG
jgi:hypothetical protein